MIDPLADQSFDPPTQGPPQGPAQGPSPGYPPGYPPYGMYPPQGPYGGYPVGPYRPVPPTNTMAILAIIFAFVLAPLGIVFGVIAKKEIRHSGESGDGLAVAGIWVGAVFTVISALMIVLWIVLFSELVHNLPQILPTPSPQ